jgi:hypothetical protein
VTNPSENAGHFLLKANLRSLTGATVIDAGKTLSRLKTANAFGIQTIERESKTSVEFATKDGLKNETQSREETNAERQRRRGNRFKAPHNEKDCLLWLRKY